MKRILMLLALTFSFFRAFSQETASQSDTLRKDALNVFMEASDFIKKEIPFINYVRDIKVADVYIISTEENTGSGGSVSTFFIVGQGKYEGMADTLKCNFSPDETTDIRRAKQVKTMKMGLMRYVAKTPLAQFMNINFSEPLSETVSSDKWNSWVYSANMQVYSYAEKSQKYGYLYGNLSANRITEKSKFESSLSISLQKNKTVYLDTLVYISEYRNENLNLSYVKSINDHWSAGGSTNIQISSYNNYDLNIKIMPGIEYDIFPYSESTRHQLRFLYQVGLEINNYSEETDRFKLKETLARQSLSASLTIIQKWGSVSSTLTWSNYFFDWSYNNLRLYTKATLRIIKGLSFSIQGNAALIHDQISLPIGNATLEDVLLQRKMQATNYSYWTSFGFTYTFGSIYNNVVNPRFGN
ncbi:MAG: hypothetical protein Q7T72_01110 [Bacteroidales bacterium]|nr:hypothetical protein [Bacteroidales bacterium]